MGNNVLDEVIKYCYKSIEEGGNMSDLYGVINKCNDIKSCCDHEWQDFGKGYKCSLCGALLVKEGALAKEETDIFKSTKGVLNV